VEEVNASKGSSDERINMFSTQVDLGLSAAVREYVVVSKLAQYKLRIIGVSSKVLEAMKTLAQTP
jgi:hypothetical protein